ncbi:carboxypeptidase M-like [Pleurodeles waltl]|uniref:carboxypeptidase M-like n=1 Tax=Pleurodeles waltl TaxID=8319 RepID=UPI0037098D95
MPIAHFLSWWLLVGLVLCHWVLRGHNQAGSLEFVYHSQQELESILKSLNQEHSSISHVHSIGESVQGVPLWVMIIGLTPRIHRVGVPDFKYIANIHGNEPVGRELLLHLAHHLLTHYGYDPHITALVNSTRIHILPAMNPDGFKVAAPGDCDGEQGRQNFHGVDLNRNFPDFFANNSVPREPETQAVMRWFRSESFVLSAVLHGGAMVVVYPYSNDEEAPGHLQNRNKYADEDVFKHLAKIYSFTHPEINKGNFCGDSFPKGIVKGAKWYPIVGGLQDYNYMAGQCYELTLELSCCKYPEAANLPELWEKNREALIRLIGQIHGGLKGRVLDAAGNPLPEAVLQILNRKGSLPYRTNALGEFYKLLLPGNYTFQVRAEETSLCQNSVSNSPPVHPFFE